MGRKRMGISIHRYHTFPFIRNKAARIKGETARTIERGSPSADMMPPMMAKRMATTETSTILNKLPFIGLPVIPE